MKYMTIGLRKKVSLALLPIDDFTDRIITGSQLHVYIKEGNIPSIRKPDGYHIFCDLAGSEAEICMEGPLYQRKVLKLPLGQGEPNIYRVRILPSVSYPLSQGTTIVKGVLPKNSELRLIFPGQRKGCKLLYDYDPDVHKEELCLFRPYEMSLEGKTLCISGKDGIFEFLRVSDQRGNSCVLEQPLSKAYQKSGTGVYPVYEAAAGEDGSVYLPIGNLAGEETCVCILRTAGGEEKTCEIVLTAGRESRITEDIWKEES